MGSCRSKNEVGPNDTVKKRSKANWDLQTLSNNGDQWQAGQPTIGVNCMALSEDTSMVATGNDDASIKIYSTKTERIEMLACLRGHNEYINCLLFEDMEDGNVFLLSASADKTIKKWNVATLECVFTLEGHGSVINRLICTGEFIFSSSYDRSVRCWSFDSGQLLRSFTGHKRGVYPIIFIPEFTPDPDDQDAAASNKNFPQGNANNDVLITGSADMTARAFAFDTGKTFNTFTGHEGAITCMTVDEKGKQLFTGATDFKVFQWNIIRGTLVKKFEGHTGAIICVMMKNKILYTGSADHTARSWIVEFGDCARTYTGFKHTIIAMRFFKGIIYTACGDGVARAHDAKSGALKRSFEGHLRSVNCLQLAEMDVERHQDDDEEEIPNCVSDRGEQRIVYAKLFTGSVDGTLRVWDASGLKDETIFTKDDEKKRKEEKERQKRLKKKQKERAKATKAQQKMGRNTQQKEERIQVDPNQDMLMSYHGGSNAADQMQFGGYMDPAANAMSFAPNQYDRNIMQGAETVMTNLSYGRDESGYASGGGLANGRPKPNPPSAVAKDVADEYFG